MPDPVIELEDSQQGPDGALYTTMSPEQLAERNRLLAAVLAGTPRYLDIFHVSEGNTHHRGGRAWQATGQTVQLAEDRIGEVTSSAGGIQGAVLRIDQAMLASLIEDKIIRIMPGRSF